MSFSSLGLAPSILAILETLKYESPTPIQTQAIPAVLAHQDVIAGAQTGTGKTAAFALPLLHRLLEEQMTAQMDTRHENEINTSPKVSVLVLTPTRELAQQVHKSFVMYANDLPIRSTAVYGGVSLNTQVEILNKGIDVLVATPGRLLELLMKNLVSVEHLQTLVIDEADRMLDMGFIIDIERIMKKLPAKRQTLFFSATFDDSVFELSKRLLTNPTVIEVSARNTAVEQIEQLVYTVDKDTKSRLISYLIGSKNWQQVLIFTRTKQGADALAKEMIKDGIETQSIHGDKSQGARDRALNAFRLGEVRALVATDIAARGLDIEALSYVINHELPYNAEDYIHRIGRTGRAGQAGIAINLVSETEQYLLADIETLLNISLVGQWYPGFEPNLNKSSTARAKRSMSNKEKRKRALKGNPKRR